MRIDKLSAILAIALLLGAGSVGIDAKGKKDKAAPAPEKTRYEKIFGDKKYKTAEGFLKMHLLEDDKIIVELPRNLTGRDILVTSGVDQTSHGVEGTIGYVSPSSIHITFEATDSLVLMKEVSAYKYFSTEANSDSAIKKAHKGAIVASFPIAALSPDSSAYVFDATAYFKSHDERLDPVDPLSSNSFDGLVSAQLTHQSSMSMLKDIYAYPDNMSVTSYETYKMGKTALGMRTDGEATMTVLLRRSLFLLPEEPMRPRIADARIGVNGRPFTKFMSTDKGSETVWYADRYDSRKEKLVFYVDTLFTEPYFKAIKAGVEKWNDAFAALGKPAFLSAERYPSASQNPEFDANDMRFSCVKYEAASNSRIRCNCWADPRSGEIISSCIYIPFDIMTTLQASLLLELGDAAPSVRTTSNTSPLLYDAIQSIVTNKVGTCLGLTPNYLASRAYPLDSLRSASFTQAHGLSASIMDDVPYNFVAQEGDGEKGVCLIQTEIGPYDKYAVKWLYGEIEVASTPEEEVPYLDEMIESSRTVKELAYARKPSARFDVRYNMDPRLVAGDLGDDEIASAEAKLSNLKNAIAHLDEWIGGQDPTYTFRPYMNTVIMENSCFALADLLNYVGGFYLENKKDGDQVPSYTSVPAQKQEAALNFVLEQLDDLSWLDNTHVYRDIYFVRSFEGYLNNMIIDNLMYRIKQLSFTETVSEDPYTRKEAFDAVLDHVLKNTREGKAISETNLAFQYVLLNFTLNSSNAAYRPSQGTGIYEDAGFTPMSVMEFKLPETIDYLDFQKLKELRDVYRKAARKTSDKKLAAQYDYFVMAIDRVL